jgi:hypothetical protein
MSVMTEMSPMTSIAGVDALRCFEIPHDRPITYLLDHHGKHKAGSWFDDYAVKDGTNDPNATSKTAGLKDMRRQVTHDSSYVIVVRNECRDLHEPVIKTVLAVYYRPGIDMAALEARALLEQS